MKKVLKNTLAMFMAMVMVFGAVPLSGFVGFELPKINGLEKLSASVSELFDGFTLKAKAVEYTSDIYTYTLSSDNKATITKVASSARDEITIPATLDEYPVVAIGSSAFTDKTYITSVVIPDSVTSIGNYAFSGCTRLALIDLGNVKSLGYGVFNNCTSLTSITIPNTLTTAGYDRWTNNIGPLANSGIKTVVFEEGIANIPDYICSQCTTLTSVTLPEKEDTVDGYKIGNYAFYNTSLSTVELPESITAIGNNAFDSCTMLTEIELKENVKSVGEFAFSGCSRLVNVKLGENVTSISNYAFSGCTRLALIDLGNVKSLGYGVFNNCTSLTSITIPNTLTTAGYDRWTNNIGPLANSGIKTVVFEEGIANIPDYICSQCTTLTSVTLPEKEDTVDGYKIGNYAFYNCYNLSDVILPLSLTKIGEYSFGNCTSLGRMTIPSSVTGLSATAFTGASAQMHIPAEDSQIALILIDNEIPFTSNESGIKDAGNRYLNRDNTSYYSTFSAVSSSGLVTLSAKYDFKASVKNSISNMKLKIRIPSTVTLAANTVKINGVVTDYSLSGNILTVNLTKTSGTVTFSVKPTSSTYLTTYALMEYRLNGSSKTETVGIVNMATKVLTIDVPEETSKTRITVTGVASPEETVSIYVNGESVGTCVASKVGNYSKSVALKTPVDGKVYTIEVRITETDGTQKSVTDFVTYNVETVKMTSCVMYYAGKEYNMMNISGSSPVVTWQGGSFTFRVTFENSSIIDDLYIVSKKGNEIKKIKAVFDKEENVFVATGFEGYLPGTISIDYRADNKEYIVDANETIDFKKEYEELPQVLKEAEVQVFENTIDEETNEGKISGIIKTTDGSNTTIEYSMERKPVTTSAVTESSLKQQGYTKVKTNTGTYSYVKIGGSNQSNILSVDRWEFDEWGNLVYNTTQDVVINMVDDGIGTLSAFANIVGLIVDSVELAGKQVEVSQIKNQIMAMNISTAEKQARLEALNDLNDKSTTVKLLKMLSTEFLMGAGLVAATMTGPWGIAAAIALTSFGVINNMAWTNLENNMEGLFNDFTTNLLNVLFRFAVDPSGFIYEAITGNRLSGVKATAYFKATEEDTASVWDASEYEQSNPIYTDLNGCYSWDVPEGLWQVKFEKEGYETTYSEWLPVPPPQLDVNIGMNSLSAPEVSYINVYQDGIEIGFTQYMNIDSINSTNVVFTNSGTVIFGDFEAVDAEFNYEGTVQYAKTFFFTPKHDISGTVAVEISNVENYCSNKIAETYSQTHNVSLRIDSMNAPEFEAADYKAEKNIVVQAYPAEAANGKTVSVTMSNSYIAKADSLELTFDEEGKATLNLTMLLPGDVDITFKISDSALSATTSLSVSAKEAVNVTSVMLNTSSISIKKGETRQLTAFVAPSDADNKNVTWISSDASVATVDENGLVNAIRSGKAVISVVTEDGEFRAYCDVNVAVDATSVTLKHTTLELAVGASTQNEAIVTPANTASSIKWTSNKPSVATVDSNGLIIAVAPGKAEITASVNGGELTAVCEVTVLARAFNISWIVDGVPTSQKVNEGSVISIPSNPVKDGYRFIGWTPSVPATMPAYDLSFTAVFEKIENQIENEIKVSIRNPSTTTINYGNAIILHADIDGTLPEGTRIEWTASNGNFDMSVSADGLTCKVSPKSSGKTVFTATVYDKDGNVISSDTQEMTAKAGFFDKIVAFFKKIFGLTKTFPEAFKGIF